MGGEIGWGGSGRVFEFEWEWEGGGGGRLLTFSSFRMGAYSRSRWALIRDWALIRINTVLSFLIGSLGIRHLL